MKKAIFFVLLFTVIACSGFVVLANQAEGEQNEHIHNYTITVNAGEAVFTCSCGDSYTEHFGDYLNTDREGYDVNYDGIINGKDYIYLKQHKTGFKPIWHEDDWEAEIDL